VFLCEQSHSLRINQPDCNSEFSISTVVVKIQEYYKDTLLTLFDNDENIKNQQVNKQQRNASHSVKEHIVYRCCFVKG